MLRVALVFVLVAFGVALTAAWGWNAALVYGFLLFVTLIRLAGVVLGGTVIQGFGAAYFKRRLHGRP